MIRRRSRKLGEPRRRGIDGERERDRDRDFDRAPDVALEWKKTRLDHF